LPKGYNAGVVSLKSLDQAGHVTKNSVLSYWATAVMVAGLYPGDKAALWHVRSKLVKLLTPTAVAAVLVLSNLGRY
jgi:hypothetical protein